MFERLKRALVESFVGAIALGWLLAQGIWHFVNIFAAPVTEWVARNKYPELRAHTTASAGVSLQFALPDLVRFILILLVWYALVRWLYFKPPKKQTSEPAPDQVQAA